MFYKPFVYLSSSVVTPSRSVQLIRDAAEHLNAKPLVDTAEIWRRAALGVHRQAALYRSPGFKGENWHTWLKGVLGTVADGFSFQSEAERKAFKDQLLGTLGKPDTYYVPHQVRQFLLDLEKSSIGWGVIANENHLYQAVLKKLHLAPPGPVIAADGPTMFKPLPKIWTRAVERAPARSKHDIWFVGSAGHPCDTAGTNNLIRTVLVAPELERADSISMHFRISSIDDLRPVLIPPHRLQLPDFELLEQTEAAEEGTNDDVVLAESFRPALPQRGEPEHSIATLRKSINVK